MSKSRNQPRARFVARIVCALGVISSACNLTAACAEAGCSDYVMFARSGGHAAQLASSPMDDPAPPCRGPECGRRLPSPLPPQLPVRTVAFDAWTGLTILAGQVASPSILCERATFLLPPAVAPRLDRPPKVIL
jgi:hypothetical protein